MFVLKIISLIILAYYLIVTIIGFLKDDRQSMRVTMFVMFLILWIPFIYIYIRG